jgi:hypothetical protein
MHQDYDSIYTLVVMLSDTNSFQGGRLVLRRSNASQVKNGPVLSRNSFHLINITKYHGILFDSLEAHAVEPILAGINAEIYLNNLLQ